MTTQVNNQQGQNAVQGSPNAGNAPFVGGQISAGPAALASTILYEIMAMYSQILKYNQEQKVNMVTSQAAAAQGGAQATRDAGYAQMVMYAVMGSLGVAGAAAGIGIQQGMMRNAEGAKIADTLNDSEEALNPMKSMESALAGTKPSIANGGAVPTEDEVAVRMGEFERNDFTNAKNDATTQRAIEQMKARGLDEDDDFDFDNWKDDFNNTLDRRTQDYNSAASNLRSRQDTIVMYKSYVDAFKGLGDNSVQAWGQSTKSGHDADASLQSTTSQMAGSSAGDFGAAMNKAFDAQNAVVQILDRMQDSNSVRG